MSELETLNQLKEIIQSKPTALAVLLISDILTGEAARYLMPGLYPNQGPPPTRKVLACDSLLNSWDSFSKAEIPHPLWKDIEEMVLKVLLEFIDSPTDEYQSLPSYQQMMALRNQRIREIESLPQYKDAFKDLLGK